MMLKNLALMLCMLLTTSSFAQKYTVKGSVSDANTRDPLADVNISIVGESGGGITNSQGNFQIKVENLPALLYFSHMAYAIEQVEVNKTNKRNMEVFLFPEIQDLEEVTISAERVQKVSLGDTLNVIDYAVVGDRILLAATPYRNQLDQRLYLTDLQGKEIHNLPIKSWGKQIKIPEQMTPEYMFLFEDFMGSFHVLTRKTVQQIDWSGDSIKLTYKTSYPVFLKSLLSIKVRLGESLFFQRSNKEFNRTIRTGPDAYRPQLVKTIWDPHGVAEEEYALERYKPRPGSPRNIYKYVSAPIIRLKDEVLIFDFFANHMESFDSLGQSKHIIPIDFHNKTKLLLPGINVNELDQKEFRQVILLDKATGKIYALFHRIGQRAKLKEIDPSSGQVMAEIEIPDFPNVDKIKVFNNVVYFIYQVNFYPFYTNLYRMKI